MAEKAFSSIKRMFGEYVSVRKFPNMVKEMLVKVKVEQVGNRFATPSLVI